MMSWNIKFRYYQSACIGCAAGLWRAGCKWHYLQLSLWLVIAKCLSPAADLRGYITLSQPSAKHIREFICPQKLCGKIRSFLQWFNCLSYHGITHRTDQKTQPKKPSMRCHWMQPKCNCRNRAGKNEGKRHKNRGWILFSQVEKNRVWVTQKLKVTQVSSIVFAGSSSTTQG